MMKRKIVGTKDLKLNVQFEVAFKWLQLMKVVKTAKELAIKMEYSETVISDYLNMKRPVSDGFAYKFEKMFLLKQTPKTTLEDFQTPVLINQAKKLEKVDMMELLQFLSTEIVYIKGGVQTILEELDKAKKQNIKLNKQIGELHKLIKKGP